MIHYIIVAQVARGAAIWATTRVARKVFKTVATAAITFYLVERVKRQKKIDERKGLYPDK